MFKDSSYFENGIDLFDPRNANNNLLVLGSAGSGKTELVRGIAARSILNGVEVTSFQNGKKDWENPPGFKNHRAPRRMFVFDGWLFGQDEQLDAQFIKLTDTSRLKGIGVVFTAQSLKALLQTPSAIVFMSNFASNAILNLSHQDADTARDWFGLSRIEKTYVQTGIPGRGLLLSGGNRYVLKSPPLINEPSIPFDYLVKL